MKTLITPARVVALAFAGGEYMPPETVTEADIAAAEQRYIVPVIGPRLYARLLEGAYAEFLEEYLAPAVACAARLVVQAALDVRTGPAGTVVPRSGGYLPADSEHLCLLRRALRTKTRALLRRAAAALDAQGARMPEYDPGQNILTHYSIDGNIFQVL